MDAMSNLELHNRVFDNFKHIEVKIIGQYYNVQEFNNWLYIIKMDYPLVIKQLQQSQNRELVLREALEVVVNTFKKDIEQGYITSDKWYVIEVLSKALEASK